MTISKDLFLAILAMDSYNRGEDFNPKIAGLDTDNTDCDDGTCVGDAKILDIGPPEGAAGQSFFALAYDTSQTGIEGIRDTTISFRGTDDIPGSEVEADSEFQKFLGGDFVQGWSVGAGAPVGQATLARDYVELVLSETGGAASAFDAGAGRNLTVTGHSLGGGLAGFASYISGANGAGMDHMPYGKAGYLAVISEAWSRYKEQKIQENPDATEESIFSDFKSNVSEHTTPSEEKFLLDAQFFEELGMHVPSFADQYGISVEYEVNAGLRNGGIAIGLGTVLGGLLSALINPVAGGVTLMTGLGIAADQVLAEDQIEQTILDTWDWTAPGLVPPVTRHSPSLLATLQYDKDETEGNAAHGDWHELGLANPLLDLLFNNDLALAAGAKAFEGAHKEKGEFSSISGKAIAYSALQGHYSDAEEDQGLVFGNTGIRALFDDVNELARVADEDGFTRFDSWWSWLGIDGEETLRHPVLEAAVQFATQMALQKVDYKNGDADKFDAEQGILKFVEDGEMRPYETVQENNKEHVSADLLHINLAGALWDLELDEENDLSSADEKAAPQRLMNWIEKILTSESEAQQTGDQPLQIDGTELPLLFGEVFGVGDKDRYWGAHMGVAEKYIRDVFLTLDNAATDISLPESILSSSQKIGSGISEADLNEKYYQTASLFISSEEAQRVEGSNANTVFALSDHDDLVYLSTRHIEVGGEFAGGGQDVVYGRGGADTIVDYFVGETRTNTEQGGDGYIDDVIYGGDRKAISVKDFFAKVFDVEQVDEFYYSRMLKHDDPTSLAQKGLTVTDVTRRTVRDIDFIAITTRDDNFDDAPEMTDLFNGIERVYLTADSDTAIVEDDWLEQPILLDFADFGVHQIEDDGETAEIEVTRDDFDEISFKGLETGIDLINGSVVATDDDEIAYRFTEQSLLGSLFSLSRIAKYVLGFSPEDEEFPFKIQGAERIIGTEYGDNIVLAGPSFLSEYFGDWDDEDRPQLLGEVKGGAGGDNILIYRPGFVKEGDPIPVAYGGAEDGSVIAGSDLRTTIDGGTGDDWIVALGGQGTKTIGGMGRDWIFNTASYNPDEPDIPGGVIYGDTVDGQSTDGTDIEGPENSDNIWWWPGVTMADPGRNDLLKFFGVPLVGGTNDLPFSFGPATVLNSVVSVTAWATFRSPLYFDYFLPFMSYMKSESGELYVINAFSTLFGAAGFETVGKNKVNIRGAMQFLDFQDRATYWSAGFREGAEDDAQATNSIFGLTFAGNGVDPSRVGDMGMLFKNANPLLDLFALIPGFPGGLNRMLPMIDKILTLAAAVQLWGKAWDWDEGVDPLILDLDGDGIETISREASRMHFDFDGDYFAEQSGWLSGDDGFLVSDDNGNGIIDDISEMFGGVGASGFAELALLDANDDGVVDAADPGFASLQIWRDLNEDGITDPGELFTLDELGIVSLSLSYENLEDAVTPQGTALHRKGEFSRDDGSTGTAYDAVFELNQTNTVFRGEKGVAPWLSDKVILARGFGTITDFDVAMSSDLELSVNAQTVADQMTTPRLSVLRAQAAELMGQWAFSLNLTRELTPVLLETVDGALTLVDHAVYVEDESGGYWTLSSGADILDADAQPIARPDLSDVMAQATGSGQTWQLEQMFSPSTRGEALQHRENAPYLVDVIDGRAVVQDYGIQQPDGSWQLASGTPVTDADGAVIDTPAIEDILAMEPPQGQEWRIEELGFSRYANLEVEEIGVNFIDGEVVDYTVLVTDEDGSFHVWARNLDRALELQAKYGTARDFNLRNYEIDFDTLDEVGSTDDSQFRVELLTPGQFHLATSLAGIAFQPEMLGATIDADTGVISYTISPERDTGAATLEGYVSGINAMIDVLQPVMQQYIEFSRSFSAKMALQGGLKDLARGIEYLPEIDSYRATTERELAPLFEAIFEQMPADYNTARDYLFEWGLILSQVYSDYAPSGDGNIAGAQIAVDQLFVMQMALAAHETTPTVLDPQSILYALSIDESRLVEHDETATEVTGTNGTDYLYMTAGEQTYSGGRGADTFFVSTTSGSDIIDEVDTGGRDGLRFIDVSAEEVTAERKGQDLLLHIDSRGETITVTDQFLGELNPLLSDGSRLDSGVDNIGFADGTLWDRFRISMEVSNPTDEDQVIIGSGSADVLRGGRGNDVLRGGTGGDYYFFNAGDGQDVVGEELDFGSFVSQAGIGPVQGGLDMIFFGEGISEDRVRLQRDGNSDDLQIFVLDDEGNETGDSLYVEDQFGGVRLNLGILGQFDPSLEIDYVAPFLIERFIFDDGGFLDFEQIIERVLKNAKTDGDDAIYGMLNDNTLDGGAGDDFLTGLEGGDTYVFGRGYGEDVMLDDDDSMKLFGSPDDTLRFVDDLRWTDFTYERDGATDTLTLHIGDTDDAVVLTDYLKTAPFRGYINLLEKIEFADGTVWDYTKLLQHYVNIAKTTGNDTIYGFSVADIVDGGAGDDRLEGQGGGDTYIFQRGYGEDVILDTGGIDRVALSGVAAADVTFTRTDLDLILTIDGTGDRLILENQYVRDFEQGFAVEEFVFSDRTMVYTDLNPEDIDIVGTAGADTLRGSNFNEKLDGRAGDDELIGRDGGDTYVFDAGYGNDVIIDAQERASWTDRDYAPIPKSREDIVEFGADITTENVQFAKSGEDLVITIVDRPDTLTVRNQFTSLTSGIEEFRFFDGSLLFISDVEELLQIEGGNRGDNLIEGLPDQPNALDGRQGDDTLIGGTAGDDYAFGAGYDLDRIEETADATGVFDRVIFGETVRAQDLILRRQGDDLLIDLGNGADVLTIVGGLGQTTIEEFLFADGTVLTTEDIRDRLLEGTDGDDLLIGFDGRSDDLDGGAGSDAMEGGTGDDTYSWGYGDGPDSVRDTGGIDTIAFKPGITLADLSFAQVGTDIVLTLDRTTETLVILQGASQDSADWVENFAFDNGDELTLEQVRSLILQAQSNGGMDLIDANDLDTGLPLIPGPGFDSVLMGSDTRVVFGKGDGIDRITPPDTIGTAEIYFDDLTPADAEVRITRLDGSDLTISFPETGDQVILVGARDRAELPALAFADGTIWTRDALFAAAVEAQVSDQDDLVFGTAQGDRIEAGLGDDDIRGAGGDDSYVFTRGDGRDIISDSAGSDTLEVRGYTRDEMRFTRPVADRDELVITFDGTGDEIVLRYGTNLSGVDTLVLADGTTLTRDQMSTAAVGKGTAFDDVITGSSGAETLEGGLGDDTLEGGSGNDVYIYRAGDGRDVIDEAGSSSNTNRLLLPDYTPDEVTALAMTNRYDVMLRFPDGGEIILENGLYRYSGRVSHVEFADGTVWTRTDLEAAIQDTTFTASPSVIRGTDGDDLLTGTPENERIDGLSGDDDYVIARGGGHDTVTMNATYIGNDILHLPGYSFADATFAPSADNPESLVITFTGTDDRIVIENAMNWVTYSYATFRPTVETFRFDDGDYTLSDVADSMLAGQVTAGDDAITLAPTRDTIRPGTGDDTVSGHLTDDVIQFHAGDGDLQIDPNEGPDDARLELHGYTPDQVTVARDLYEENGFILTFDGSDDRIVIRTGQGPSDFEGAIGAVEFTDTDETWSRSDLAAMAPDVSTGFTATAGRDTVEGTDGTETIEGLEGDDLILPLDGPDTVVFSRGDGVDSIALDKYSSVRVTLQLTDINPGDIELVRSPVDHRYSFYSTPIELRVTDSEDRVWIGDPDRTLTQIVFGDGTIWDQTQIQDAVETLVPAEGVVTVDVFQTSPGVTIESTPQDELFLATPIVDFNLDRTYEYELGDGHDLFQIMTDFGGGGGSRIIMPDIASTDITAQILPFMSPLADAFGPPSNDLLLTFGSESDSLRIVSALSDFEPSGIVEIEFSDGVIRTLDQIIADAEAAELADPRIVADGALSLTRGIETGAYFIEPREQDPFPQPDHFFGVDNGETLLVETVADQPVLLTRINDILYRIEDQATSPTVFAYDSASTLAPVSGPEADAAIAQATTGSPVVNQIASGEWFVIFHPGDFTQFEVELMALDGDITFYDADALAPPPIDIQLNDVLPSEFTVESRADEAIMKIAPRQPDGSDAGEIWVGMNENLGDIEVTFGDGSILNGDDLLALAPTGPVATQDDDYLTFEDERDPVTIEGMGGDDVLISENEQTTFVYRRGDGNDWITAPEGFGGQQHVIEFYDIAPSDVQVIAHKQDLLLRIADSTPGAGDGALLRFIEGNILYDALADGVDVESARLASIVFNPDQFDIENPDFDPDSDDPQAFSLWGTDDINARTQPDLGTDGNDVVEDQTGLIHTYEMGRGDDVVYANTSNDTFIYRNGDGFDVYDMAGEDPYVQGAPREDVLQLPDLLPSQVAFSREFDDLLIDIPADAGAGIEQGRITIKDAFRSSYGPNTMIERVVFADDSQLTGAQIIAGIIADAATPADDLVRGSNGPDTVTGGAGDDTLAGGEGADTYQYQRGDGFDEILDLEAETVQTSGNVLELGAGITTADVSYDKIGSGLLIQIAESSAGAGDGGQILVHRMLTEGADDTVGVAAIRFAEDGSVITAGEIATRILADQATAGDDELIGSPGEDTIEALQGNDDVNGAAGDDTYVYTRGDGNDRINDDDFSSDGDTLRLQGIDPSEVKLKPGLDRDLRIIIAESTEAAGDGGHITAFHADGYGDRGIDRIVFDDGTEWLRDDFDAIKSRDAATEAGERVTGTSAAETIEGLGGDDLLLGLSGADTYVFTRGDGSDVIDDGTGAANRIELIGFTDEDVTFTRRGFDGEDLIIELDEPGDEIVFVGTLRDGADVLSDVSLTDSGTVFDMVAIQRALVEGGSGPGDDIILGTAAADTLTGGSGSDLISGEDGNDTYAYSKGDGDDRISDTGGDADDVLTLADLNPQDVEYALRAGADSPDLVLLFKDGRDRISLEDALDGKDSGVDRIVFADGTEWAVDQMRANALDYAQTGRSEPVIGFDGDDTFAGSAGADHLSGMAGSDTYVMSRGDGHDTISEAMTDELDLDQVDLPDFVSTEVSVRRLFKGSDTVVLTFASSPDDSLTLQDALSGNRAGVEQIAFSDGVIWSPSILETLLVNNAPVGLADGYFTAISGEVLTLSVDTLLRNDFDADGDPLSIIAVDGGEHGSAELDANGDIRFTADAEFFGPTQLTYTLSDGRNGISTGQVDLRVRPVAEARDDSGFTVQEDGLLTIETERLLSNDLDGDRMIVSQILGSENGTASLTSDGQVLFSPDADFNGLASFTYVANTPEGGRAEARVTLQVTPTNDAPTAVDDPGFQTREDVPFAIYAPDLLANDSDVDSDTLNVVSVTGSADMAATLTDDGYVLATPTDYFFGHTYFDYTVADSEGATAQGRAFVYVEPVNNAPEPGDDLFTTAEDNPLIINVDDVLGNDLDRDGDPINLDSLLRFASYGGTFELLDNETILFTPWADFASQARVDYYATDGQGGVGRGQIAVDVTPVNDRPVARDDSYTQSAFETILQGTEDTALEIPISELMKNDSDIEGLSLTFQNASDPADGSISFSQDGTTLIFTPDQDFWGETTFSYLVSDPEGLVDDARVTMFFENVGDAPPVANEDVIEVLEDVQIVIPQSVLLANDTDIDRDPLEITGGRLPGLLDWQQELKGTVTRNADGDFVYTPPLNGTSDSGFFYYVTDNADGTSEGFVDIQITPVNDQPTVVDDTVSSTPLDVPLVIRIVDIMANDFDVDEPEDGPQNLSFVGVDAASVGTATLQGDFIVLRVPEGFTGPVELTYRISDPEGIEDTGRIFALVEGDYARLLEGTPEDDLLIGNTLDETISGLQGEDRIEALAGNDSIDAGTGEDTILAGAGNDTIEGGDDADSINGGDGVDTIIFAASNTGVRADIGTRLGQGGHAQGDIYTDIEAVVGSNYSDTLGGTLGDNLIEGADGRDLLEGKDGADTLRGEAGNDTIRSGDGADVVDGGDGVDTADYFGSAQAVDISLADGTAQGGDAEGDSLASIENLVGTDYDDALTGDAGENVLFGGRGDDTIQGGAGDDILRGGRGADDLQGGDGLDIADYTLSAQGVSVDMADGSSGGGDAQGDTFSGIEIVQGSYHDDTLRGDEGDNVLRGGLGPMFWMGAAVSTAPITPPPTLAWRLIWGPVSAQRAKRRATA